MYNNKVTPSTTYKSNRKEGTARERAIYIKHALVIFPFPDIALVKSQHDTRQYLVHFAGRVASDCECGDYYYRRHHCKHQEAVELRLTPRKVRRSAPNETLITALQLPEGVKIRKERKGGLVRRKIVTETNGVPDSVMGLSDECSGDVLDGDMSIAEHFLQEDIRRYARSLQGVSASDLRRMVYQAGIADLVADLRRKATLIATLVQHKCAELEAGLVSETPPQIEAPKTLPHAQKFSNEEQREKAALNGNRSFSLLRA